MPTVLELVLTGALPAVITIVALAGVRFGIGRAITGRDVAIAVALGFLVGFRVVNGSLPSFPPSSAAGALFHVAVGAATLAVVVSVVPLKLWMIGLIVACGCAWMLHTTLGGVMESWTGAERAQVLVGVSVTAGLCWMALEDLSGKPGALSVWVPLLLIALVTSALLGMSGSATLARLSGALAGSIAGLIIAAMLGVSVPGNRGALMVIVPLLAAMIVQGCLLSELSPSHARLIAYAPLLLWVSRIRLVESMSVWKKTVVGCVVVLIPVGIALWQVAPRFFQEMEEFDRSGYSLSSFNRSTARS